jgi:phosphotransferase family enzyme
MIADGSELPLPGGAINAVVRVGDTVRRAAPIAYVTALLRHLEACGWPGAPRHLGVDERGRQILTYLPGDAAWEPARKDSLRTADNLAEVARLVRQFHDLTAGTDLASGAEVVCHNDLAPRNTVYRDLGAGPRPVAFIDWDIAAPGRRVHDVAHVCWQYLDLGPRVDDVAEAARLVRVIADAYGLAGRGELIETILWWQERCWRGIDAKADAGEAPMIRLREQGAVLAIQADRDWTAAHGAVLRRAMA